MREYSPVRVLIVSTYLFESVHIELTNKRSVIIMFIVFGEYLIREFRYVFDYNRLLIRRPANYILVIRILTNNYTKIHRRCGRLSREIQGWSLVFIISFFDSDGVCFQSSTKLYVTLLDIYIKNRISSIKISVTSLYISVAFYCIHHRCNLVSLNQEVFLFLDLRSIYFYIKMK